MYKLLKTFSPFLILCGIFYFSMRDMPLEKQIDSLLHTANFQGAALVATNDRILYQRAHGLADYEKNIPHSLSTIFRIGSITKEFTATAILLLEERGLLSLSDSIDTYLPDYPNGQKITIKQLLSHTSGTISLSALSNFSYLKTLPTSPAHTISYFKDEQLRFIPGTDIEYSDSGYIILGIIIEKVTNHSFAEFLDESVFIPLNMRDTYMESNASWHSQLAQGYLRVEGQRFIPTSSIDMSLPYAAGGLVSSVEDLYKWYQSITRRTLLSANSLKSMLTIHASNSEKEIAYGYGFRIGSLNKDFRGYHPSIIGHCGSIDGFKSAAVYYRDCDLMIILLSNVEETDIRQLHKQIAQIIFSYWRVNAK